MQHPLGLYFCRIMYRPEKLKIVEIENCDEMVMIVLVDFDAKVAWF